MINRSDSILNKVHQTMLYKFYFDSIGKVSYISYIHKQKAHDLL